MDARNRPLSPHLQIYRWHLLMAMSIFHRVTGCALAVGTLLLTYWIVAAASGPAAFATASAIIGSWIGLLALFGWSFALFYHLANGIRHLIWDSGRGFAIPQAYLSGRVVLGVATVLTVLAWVAGITLR
ncbi:succinate dehydrogenase, cytochrome b556 subunit [Lacibacterium aquatile]|uniref:Succinate dehydrogenase cytochrome b556 subunit n=1 Tax=Lacibacterium aquatile TaxID=1168082 RepID=A0ABW5DNI2_9PROT